MSERASEPRALQAVPGPLRDGAFLAIYAILLFFAMTVQTGQASVVIPLLVLVLSLGRAPLVRLRERLSLPLLGFLGFAVMEGAAAIYAPIGSYAVAEFNKFIVSFSLAALLLARFDRKHVRGLLWVLTAVCAVLGLLCVDMSSSLKLFHAFNGLMNALGMDFSEVLKLTMGGRVSGLYNDANVTGAMMGCAMLVGIYLLYSVRGRGKKFAASMLLGVCSVAFFTAVSRGAMLCFGLTALVFLAVIGKEQRLDLFFLMLGVGFSTVVTGAAALAVMREGSFLPDLFCFVCGLLVFLLDQGLGSRLSNWFRGRGKAVALGCGALLVLVCGFVVLALHWTGPVVLEEGTLLDRGVCLPGGSYTLDGDWDDGVSLTVYSLSRDQALMGRGEEYLYSGPLEEASFTVPEDSIRVHFLFLGEGGETLRTVRVSDGTELPLGYRLLPEMIAYRLQDNLFQSYSYLVRVQYNIDGWKLFTRSPLLGFGLGSTEGWLTSLQPFYYESLYLHNHILQVMCDMGLLGLLFWLTFLGGALWLLVRRLRKERDPLAAMLLSCWVMMVSHGLMEIDFSIRAFQCEAWVLLLLPVMLYGVPVARERLRRWGGLAAAVFLWVYLGVFAGLLESRRIANREMEDFSTNSASEFMEAMARWVKMDVFDHEQSQLNYVGNAVYLNDSRYNYNMRVYKEELEASGTYTACSGLEKYYYLPRGEYEAMFACSRKGVAQEASVSDAWNLEFDFYRLEVFPCIDENSVDVFISGVEALRADLEAFDEGRLEDIRLTEENQTFLRRVGEVSSEGLTGQAALMYLAVFGGGQMILG